MRNKKNKKEEMELNINNEEIMDISEVTSNEEIKGLGDVIKKVADTLSIPTCESCEERRKKLNSMFSFLKSVRRDVTDEEITFIENIGKSITTDERYKLADIYTAVYGSKVNHCNCPALYNGMINKLKMQIEYQQVG